MKQLQTFFIYFRSSLYLVEKSFSFHCLSIPPFESQVIRGNSVVIVEALEKL
jgi:hypothetical protein